MKGKFFSNRSELFLNFAIQIATASFAQEFTENKSGLLVIVVFSISKIISSSQ